MGPLGLPELMILAIPLLLAFLFLVVVIWFVKRSSKKSAAPSGSPAPYHSSLNEEISKLADMMDKGSITEDEFRRQKNELIKNLTP
jgi:uncharacterized membrane protein